MYYKSEVKYLQRSDKDLYFNIGNITLDGVSELTDKINLAPFCNTLTKYKYCVKASKLNYTAIVKMWLCENVNKTYQVHLEWYDLKTL